MSSQLATLSKTPGLFATHFYFVQTEMYEKTRDILYPNPAVRVKQVSDKGIASIGVSCYHISSPELNSVTSQPTNHQLNSVV